MELKQYERDVMTSGTNTTGFNVELNGAAFAVMSSSIYEHKIIAAIREYTANAYDAHVMAGVEETPFRVTLPSRLSPAFEVEDFGIGLDDNGVRKIFATYFGSTKQASSDQIGGFGLGAKSAFAYTDSFNIIARKDGIERNYVAFIGKTGIPDMTLMAEHQTPRGNGVKISIPVQSRDFRVFHRESSIILSMFKTKPIVYGIDFEFICDDVYEQIAENGYALMPWRTYSDLYDMCHAYALVGGVIYPIQEAIESKFNSEKFHIIRNGQSMIIPFDINEVFPVASRERIQLADNASNFISGRINNLIDQALVKVQEEISKLPNTLAAVDYSYDKFSKSDISVLRYNGKTIYSLGSREMTAGGFFNANMVVKKRGIYGRIVSVTPQRHTALDIVRAGKIHIFHRDPSTPKTGYLAKCKRHAREHYGEGCTFSVVDSSTNLTQHKKDRLQSYYNGKAIFIEFNSFRHIYKDAKKQSTTETHDRGEKTVDTIYGKHVNEYGMLVKVENHEIDPKFAYTYIDKIPSAGINTRYMVPNVEHGMRVLLKTKVNARKIEERGIQEYSEYCSELLEKYSDYSRYMNLKCFMSLTSIDTIKFEYYEWSTLYNLVPECHEKLGPIVQEFVTLVDKYKDFRINERMFKTHSNPVSIELDRIFNSFSYLTASASTEDLIRLRVFAQENGFTL